MAPAQVVTVPYPSGGSDSASVPTQAGPRFRTYLEYIDCLSQTLPPSRCFDWLYAFLSTLPDPGLPPDRRPKTRVLVADATDAGWRLSRSIDRDTLRDDHGVKARVIVIECPRMSWIDRNVIDAVALFYDLNPIYLWGVLSRNRVDLDYDIKPLFELHPNPFDGPEYDTVEINALELIHSNKRPFDQGTFDLPSMSGTVIQNPPGNVLTSLIISEARNPRYLESMLSHFVSQNIISVHKEVHVQDVPELSWNIDVYEQCLLRRSNARVNDMIQRPAEALFLYQNIVLHGFAQNMAQASGWLVGGFELPQQPDELYLEVNRLDLTITLATSKTKRYAQKLSLMDLPEATKAFALFEQIQTTISKHKDHYDKHMQSQIGKASLAESRKSIEMADSVKLLTQLAFIFIPLTFSATIFGINVHEFGTGDMPISAFVITALVVTASTFILWWLGGKVLTKQYQRLLFFAVWFFWLSPSRAFLFVIFILFGKYKSVSKDLNGLSGLSWLERWVMEDFAFPSHKRFSSRQFTTSDFWISWLTPMEEFVSTPNWKKNYAIYRWNRNLIEGWGVVKRVCIQRQKENEPA